MCGECKRFEGWCQDVARGIIGECDVDGKTRQRCDPCQHRRAFKLRGTPVALDRFEARKSFRAVAEYFDGMDDRRDDQAEGIRVSSLSVVDLM